MFKCSNEHQFLYCQIINVEQSFQICALTLTLFIFYLNINCVIITIITITNRVKSTPLDNAFLTLSTIFAYLHRCEDEKN